MSSRLRSEANSVSTIEVASSKRLVRCLMVAARCMVKACNYVPYPSADDVTRFIATEFGAWALDTVSADGRLSQSLQAEAPEEAANAHAGT